MNSFETPILLIAFRRPDLTACVFDRIRQVKPKKLYVAIDGADKVSDSVMVKQVIKTIKVDWECEVFWKINAENMGCRNAVASAISWFFSSETKGIILEDDCFPDTSFFMFCERMLQHYEFDSRIGHISGSSYIPGPASHSHYFSKYSFTWGWASWARVWKDFDLNVSDHLELDYANVSDNVFERIYWRQKFHQCNNGLNTWDYQLTYLMFKNRYKAIVPSKNLITNIGFNNKATHWNLKNLDVANLPTESVEEIAYPIKIETNQKTDVMLYNKIYKRSFLSNIFQLVKYVMKNGFDQVIFPQKLKRNVAPNPTFSKAA